MSSAVEGAVWSDECASADCDEACIDPSAVEVYERAFADPDIVSFQTKCP